MSVNYADSLAKNGKYYSPAHTHYLNEGQMNNNNKPNISCDRCSKEHLIECVGFDKIDLCLECVEQIAPTLNFLPKKRVVKSIPKRMFQRMFRK